MRKKLYSSIYQEKKINSLQTYMFKQTLDDNFFIALFLPFGANIAQYILDGKEIKSGSAHFIEHRLFSSINGDVSLLCQNLGLSANAMTSSTFTEYYIYGPKKHLQEALQLLFDMFFYIKRDEKKLNTEKKIIISEGQEDLVTIRDNFEYKAMHKIFQKTYLENLVIGKKDDIKKATYDDLISYHEAFYHKDKAIFLAIGNFSFLNVEKFIKNYQFPLIKSHNLVLHKQSLKKLKKNIIFKTKFDEEFYYYSFSFKRNSLKEKEKFTYYFDFLESIIASSSLMEKIKKTYSLSEDIYLDCQEGEDFFQISFQAKLENDMEDIILNKILKNIKKEIDESDLEAYFKGAQYDTIFNFDDVNHLNDIMINILDNKKEVYDNLTNFKYFTIQEFYDFIDKLINDTDKTFICLRKD